MKWLKEYKNQEVCLVGDDELTVGRSSHIQMLYEFDIMSTSLPNIEDPNMTTAYISELPSLSFDVPSCPENKTLKGINVTFKYALSGDDWGWFCKISTTNGVDLVYNPKVFGKPEADKVCIWLSYWPIGNKLNTGDTVHVSIVKIKGLKVHECGVSLVYSNKETMENNLGMEEFLGGDLSGFQLSTGAFYLCRRDFFVGRLSPDWFRILVGDTVDYTEVQGWRKTGRPKQVNPSFIELKSVRCIIHGPQLEDIYKITEVSKLSSGDKNVAFTSSLLEGEMNYGTRSELTDAAMEESGDEKFYDCTSGDEMFYDSISTFDEESDTYSHRPPLSLLRISDRITDKPKHKLETARTSKAFASDKSRKYYAPPQRGRVKKQVFKDFFLLEDKPRDEYVNEDEPGYESANDDDEYEGPFIKIKDQHVP